MLPAPERLDAFLEAYEDHVWDVYGFFGYRVRLREEAEDLTQATFERALRAWHRFDPQRASPRTWLLAIARNLLVDHYRGDRSQLQVSTDDADEAALGVSEPAGENLGLAPELAEALATLSTRDREVVALRFGGDLGGPEIADLTGLSLANVQQILSRSLRRLRAELEREASRA